MENNEYENAKEFLESIAKFDVRIETMKKEILYWRNQDDVDATSHIQNLQQEIKGLRTTKLKISTMINKLPDYIGQAIFIKRYILGEKWKDIAKTLGGMSERNVHYIHENSMEEFIKLLQEEKQNDKN